MSDYILTYTRTKFYPLNPMEAEVKIEDIAHALSMMTRANGHFGHFYSVAQHSINCAKEAAARGYSTQVQLGALLHDASEAYLSDITRPVKKNLPSYTPIESKLQSAIFRKYNLDDLTPIDHQEIKAVDDGLLYYEFKSFMDVEMFEVCPEKKADYSFQQEDFTTVEKEFITTFDMLTNQLESEATVDNQNNSMSKHNKYKTIGIDGSKGKWVAVCIHPEGFEVRKYNTIADVCEQYPEADAYLIDMPMGLPTRADQVRPDNEVRKMLGKKGSSIFQVPCRQAVYADSKEEARAENIKVFGKSLSEQSLGIAKSIRQVDEYMNENPKWKNVLMESSPELCFMQLNGGELILENKLTEDGKRLRIEVLEKYYPDTKKVVEKYLSDVPNRKKVDDVLDALSMAVIGQRIMEYGLRSIPEEFEYDGNGIGMRVVVVQTKGYVVI